MTKFFIKLSFIFTLTILSVTSTLGQAASETYYTCSYVVTANISRPTCFGNGNGHVELVFNGVTDSPELEWIYPAGTLPPANVDNSSAEQPELFAGDYRVRVQDNVGCVDTIFLVLTEPSEVQVSANKNNVSCPGENDGSLSITAEGGVGFFKFSMDGINFFENPTFDQLEPGQYEVFAKDNNNCLKSKFFTIFEPQEPDMEVETEDVNCPDGNDAVFIVVIDSGVLLGDQDYEYSLDGVFYQEDSTFENLEAGDYIVYAKNQNGCVTTKNATITQPDPPNVTLNRGDVSCHGGANGYMYIEMTGATPPYQFSINGLDFQAGILFANLTAGTYEVFIVDAHGCDYQHPFQIFEPTPLVNNMTYANATCGLANGWIANSANGGVSPFSYQWSNGNTEAAQTNLDEGNFKITVTDYYGCQLVDTISLLNERAATIDEMIEGASCYEEENGWIDLELEGQGPFEIEWSNNEVTTTIENLMAGRYTVTVTDSNNCLTTETFEVAQPDSISIFPKIFNNGETGGVDLQVEGGTPPFTFEWSTGQQASKVVNLNYGVYTVTVTDANDCVGEKTFELDLPNRNLALRKMISVYPIPTDEDLFLTFNLPTAFEVEFEIFDELGRKIFGSNLMEIKRETFRIDLSHLAAGGYFLKIKSGEYVDVRRIVKMSR